MLAICNAACVILVTTLTSQAGSSTEVVVETWNGRTIYGTIDAPAIIMTTEFGIAHIELDKLLMIANLGEKEPSQEFLALTDGGYELRGRLTPPMQLLEIGQGPEKVRLGGLRSLTVIRDGKPRGVSDFSGSWASSFGPMRLEQEGLQVTGGFGFDNEQVIKGRVKGDRLEFTYGQSGESGWFEIDDLHTLLTGGYKGARGDLGFWGAYPIAPSMPEPEAGQIVTGQSLSSLNFCVRVPEPFDPDHPIPAVALLHGSNMSARAYIETVVAAWPDIARDFILVGIDGERVSSSATPERMAYNYTYVNYGGPGIGPKWAHRQSPALVAETLLEIQEAMPIDRWLLGGHSQGGFLTYAVAMFYPKLIAGAFPMSCNLLVQCEPDNFTDEALRADQRSIVFALIHGSNDPVVEFSGGEYCFRALQDGGFPAIQFFTDEEAGHMFARLPVRHAVRWLETMTSNDVERLVAIAEEQAQAGEYRAAGAALSRARGVGAEDPLASRLDVVEARIEELAAPPASSLLEAIEAAESNVWVDDFWAFRRDFALTLAAQRVLDAYARLREEHAKPAQNLFYEARRERDEAARTAKYREILEKYYASKWWPLVKGWVGGESSQ